jgi:integrase
VIEIPELAVEAMRRRRKDTKVIALNGLVFTRPDGRSLAVPTVYPRWHRLLERAGVPLVRPHDARHTCATLMLGQGVHPKLVSEMLGHATVAITLDFYSHATPAMHREAARTLDALLRPPLRGQLRVKPRRKRPFSTRKSGAEEGTRTFTGSSGLRGADFQVRF